MRLAPFDQVTENRFIVDAVAQSTSIKSVQPVEKDIVDTTTLREAALDLAAEVRKKALPMEMEEVAPESTR